MCPSVLDMMDLCAHQRRGGLAQGGEGPPPSADVEPPSLVGDAPSVANLEDGHCVRGELGKASDLLPSRDRQKDMYRTVDSRGIHGICMTSASRTPDHLRGWNSGNPHLALDLDC